MLLNVFERLLLRNIVPQIQGWNYANMKDARELLEGLFTEQEEADLEFEQVETQVKWKVKKDKDCKKHNHALWEDKWLVNEIDENTAKLNGEDWLPDVTCTCTPIPQERDIPVSEGLRKKIGKFLTQLDKEEKLEFSHMTLCSKFMDEASPEKG